MLRIIMEMVKKSLGCTRINVKTRLNEYVFQANYWIKYSLPVLHLLQCY